MEGHQDLLSHILRDLDGGSEVHLLTLGAQVEGLILVVDVIVRVDENGLDVIPENAQLFDLLFIETPIITTVFGSPQLPTQLGSSLSSPLSCVPGCLLKSEESLQCPSEVVERFPGGLFNRISLPLDIILHPAL